MFPPHIILDVDQHRDGSDEPVPAFRPYAHTEYGRSRAGAGTTTASASEGQVVLRERNGLSRELFRRRKI
jgi:hypothetical protein